MERYKEIVLKAEKGITFEITEEAGEKLIIKAKKELYPSACKNPPILEGYKHVCGEWNNGFVIERYYDGSQFTWVPVGILDYNGTSNGWLMEKFGRKNYRNDNFAKSEFSEDGFYEETYLMKNQWISVMNYGGFYISRYNISKNEKTGKPQSIKGAMPWTSINFADVMKVAATVEDSVKVKSHLPFGLEVDSVLEWFIQSKARTRSEIEKNSTKWGNYWSTNNSPRKVVETGSREEWCTNNIYDFAGNVDEWTQEKYEDSYHINSYRVIRGGCYRSDKPVSSRFFISPNESYESTGFRVVLCIN